MQTQPTLFDGVAPPSREVLLDWLDTHGVERLDGVAIEDMTGSGSSPGWRIVATRNLKEGEAISKIPKTAILSVRTSSLPPLALDALSTQPTSTTHAQDSPAAQPIFHLALAVLHELRLGPESEFWGYLQSLPRSPVPIPVLWELEPEGSDPREALQWLKGTEAERDMRRREVDGVSLPKMRTFYEIAAPLLPATSRHPSTSPFTDFAYAFSLVSTRAFVIDLYHTVALCPFADVLNHSATPHTSLASDDFVCHRCGSLPMCEHDVVGWGVNAGVPPRLRHLDPLSRQRIGAEEDTVDMYVERPVGKGQEVMNNYGEWIGDARLLVEWGFVPSLEDAGVVEVEGGDGVEGKEDSAADKAGSGVEKKESEANDDDDTADTDAEAVDSSDWDDLEDEFPGEGVTWDIADLLSPPLASAWGRMGSGDVAADMLFADTDSDAENRSDKPEIDLDARLVCPPSEREGVYHLNHSAQISLRLLGALYFAASGGAYGSPNELFGAFVKDVRGIEDVWASLQDEGEGQGEGEEGKGEETAKERAEVKSKSQSVKSNVSPDMIDAATQLLDLLRTRLRGLPRPPSGGNRDGDKANSGADSDKGIDIAALCDLRDALPPTAICQRMALHVLISEAGVVGSAVGKWAEVVKALGA